MGQLDNTNPSDLLMHMGRPNFSCCCCCCCY